ncbi:MAG: 50S ribosomal protein L9 [Gammaproteobacteria bacterium]|nr:MAG: 50S ribosomal protein L9 [Gammaproteobacteria bacterium]RLA17080.1 MAG: 50S ribosomal protein L9 [Gammaproteobacteria bacterium]
MEVILLERVRSLGDVGDRVEVKSGFGRNFLLPKGKAVFATKQNIAEFDARRAELEAAANASKSAAVTRAEGLEGLALQISCKAGDGGKLFGSVSAREVVKALADQGHEFDRQDVVLPEGQIRELGAYNAELHLHADVVVQVGVEVVAE